MSRRLLVIAHLSFLTLSALLTNIGCLPRTTFTKNPGPRDHGIRYYRPKPYLFVRPLVIPKKGPSSDLVELEIEYLPDFSEEYSIHIRSGGGVNKTDFKLENGWNLTSLNVDVDSQFSQNIDAIGNVIQKATPLLTEGTEDRNPAMVVHALNVPMGLYEAVISEADGDKRRIYGFRYVGFFPYSTCPVESNGVECKTCYEDQIYGLVFEKDTMVFKLLIESADHLDTTRVNPTRLGDVALTVFQNQAAQAAAQRFTALSGTAVQSAGSVHQGPDQLLVTLVLESAASMDFNARPANLREGLLVQVGNDVRSELNAPISIQVQVAEAN